MRELAQISKREHRYNDARLLYAEVNRLAPHKPEGWSDHAKMEEDCGEEARCGALLREGLKHCSFNETLLINSLRHFERCRDIEGARRLLARLRARSIQQNWRVLLEAALL